MISAASALGFHLEDLRSSNGAFIKRRGLELAGILTAHRPGDFQRYYNQPRNRIIDADAPPSAPPA